MILKLANKYRNIVVLSSGTTGTQVCAEFAKFFPNRYFTFGEAEGNIASSSAGFALRGKMPVIVADRDFLTGAFEQIRDDICESNLNVKIIINGSNSEEKKLADLLPNMKIYSETGADDLENIFFEYGPAVVFV
ncbi:hypothetical protein A3B60_04065 [Candidatus Peregrinibacteria bacterium RIFCSPLOWO2_01_FULL_39_12]|nr:MAG: hypothetical protein A3I58_01845 [Candidatus Peregrinibacteria bacterium RIFCSPLOWO2_02_FULL_39_10]OGJ42946.1 MAG: hypothetical protein A3B60_04065 [Candidatus Peregrinibacteria bacterium RIFCSPLOWO2_01_FULL_39_12]